MKSSNAQKASVLRSSVLRSNSVILVKPNLKTIASFGNLNLTLWPKDLVGSFEPGTMLK